MATVIKIDSKDLIYLLDKKMGIVYFAYTSNDVTTITDTGEINFCYLNDIKDRNIYVYFINSNKYRTGFGILSHDQIPNYIKKYMMML